MAIATFSANFNRVAEDNETDNRFGINLHAFSGTPNTLSQQVSNNTALETASVDLISDDDTATWEALNVNLALPINTDFLAIYLYAEENVFNDVSGYEFDGHYADSVSLTISTTPAPIPEPST